MNSPTAGNGAAFVSRCAAAHGKSRLMARRRFNYRDDCDLESAFLPLNGNAVGPNMNHRPGMRSSTFVAPAPRNEICSCSPRSIRVRGESSIRHDFYLSLSLSLSAAAASSIRTVANRIRQNRRRRDDAGHPSRRDGVAVNEFEAHATAMDGFALYSLLYTCMYTYIVFDIFIKTEMCVCVCVTCVRKE